jgi:hypothetical protein
VCECHVVVAQTLRYPTQLATHRHPPPSPQNSETCVHCRAVAAVIVFASRTKITKNFTVLTLCRIFASVTVNTDAFSSQILVFACFAICADVVSLSGRIFANFTVYTTAFS